MAPCSFILLQLHVEKARAPPPTETWWSAKQLFLQAVSVSNAAPALLFSSWIEKERGCSEENDSRGQRLRRGFGGARLQRAINEIIDLSL